MRFPKHRLGGLRTQLPPREHEERERQRAASTGDLNAIRAELLGITVRQVRLLTSLAQGPRTRPPSRTMRDMDALTQQGLATLKPWGRYFITEHGRRRLNENLPDMPLMLAEGDGLTNDPRKSVRGEGEVMQVTPQIRKEAEIRRLADQDRRAQARANRQKARRAA